MFMELLKGDLLSQISSGLPCITTPSWKQYPHDHLRLSSFLFASDFVDAFVEIIRILLRSRTLFGIPISPP